MKDCSIKALCNGPVVASPRTFPSSACGMSSIPSGTPVLEQSSPTHALPCQSVSTLSLADQNGKRGNCIFATAVVTGCTRSADARASHYIANAGAAAISRAGPRRQDRWKGHLLGGEGCAADNERATGRKAHHLGLHHEGHHGWRAGEGPRGGRHRLELQDLGAGTCAAMLNRPPHLRG